MNILKYSKPETKEQIMTNLVYLLRENEKMKNITAFKLGNTLDCSEANSIRWTFLESILPELNDFLRKKWTEKALPKNLEEIKKLESKLKDMS